MVRTSMLGQSRGLRTATNAASVHVTANAYSFGGRTNGLMGQSRNHGAFRDETSTWY